MTEGHSKPCRVVDENTPDKNCKNHIVYLIRSVPRGIWFPHVVLDRGGVFIPNE